MNTLALENVFVNPALSLMSIQFEDTPKGRRQALKYQKLTCTESGVDYFNVSEEAIIKNGNAVIEKSKNWLWSNSEDWKKKIISETNAVESDFFSGWFTAISTTAFIMIQNRLPDNFEIHAGGWLTCYDAHAYLYDEAAKIFNDAQQNAENDGEMMQVLSDLLKAHKSRQ